MEENQLIKERLRKLGEFREKNINPYPYRFERSHTSSEIKKEFINKEGTSEEIVQVAGRVMTFRRMGKASFATLQDGDGRIQIYFKLDDLGKDPYKLLKKLDLGDFIGVNGKVFKTHTGELTVYAEKWELLCKAIRPLPEKYHGLQEKELRYRKRYLDLIMNPKTKEVFIKRAKILESFRNTLKDKSFIDVEVPVLHTVYGGANATPFEAHFNTYNTKVFMSISPELFLKKIIVGGIERVYTICKNFRNEGADKSHNPEFTMMECYQSYADLGDMIDLCEELISNASKKIGAPEKIKYGDKTINLKLPFKRITMVDALKEYAQLDVEKFDDRELFDLRITYNINVEGDLNRGLMIQLLFEELVESKLIDPTFITEHPKETTPLAKVSRKNPNFVERFELFIAGMEISNAYSELNDPVLQRKLLEEQAKELRAGTEEAHPMDEDFCEAIDYGMPPTGGMGIGMDRIIMVLLGEPILRDIILFPFMKPLHTSDIGKKEIKKMKESLK